MSRRGFLALITLVLLLAPAGCMQISNTVRLNEDGSARVTEVIKFGPKLLTLEKQLDLGFKIEDRISEKAVKERASHMGKDVKVESRKVVNTPDGGKKMTVVYTCPEINNLSVCMVPLGPGWNKHGFRFSYHTNRTESQNAITFNTFYSNLGKVAPRDYGGRTPKPISQLELQKVRKLLPIFKDMLEGFRLSMKLEVFERKQWASYTKGAFGVCSPSYIKNGGRATLLDITDKALYTNDDALMVVIPWRQEGNERVMHDLLDFAFHIPNQHKNYCMSFSCRQYPTHREYY